ncbi:MAG: putative sugar O-methyltransferase [Alphaproteobacteria bacterium]|nr:putative sugar O-methyltransferase [Alphaproteobacteria bacterium]
MADIHLQAAASNLRKAQTFYGAHAVYERYQISSMWVQALKQHIHNILDDGLWGLDSKQVFQLLQEKHALFDISARGAQLPHALDWFERLLDQKGWRLDLLSPGFQESDLFADCHCQLRNGRRLSSDFLWRVSMLERLSHYLPRTDEKLVVVELGSGSGNFARAFKLAYPNSTYICIDIPETLFFANLFLTANFPSIRALYISSDGPGINNDLLDYDFVFIPTEFAHRLDGLQADLFVNMNSLGEMTNEVIEQWFEFLQNTIHAKKVFLLNRFLNRVDIASPSHPRRDESACAFQLDRYWDILDWEVDPDFDRSPYVRTTATRNLLIIARRCAAAETLAQRTNEVLARLPPVVVEDWAIQAYWDDDGELKSGGRYPPLSSRGDYNLTHDLTRSGSLFVIWEAYRLTGSQQYARLLLIWMMEHGGMTTPFEEIYFLTRAVDLDSSEGRLPEHLQQQLERVPPTISLVPQTIGVFNIIEVARPFFRGSKYIAVPQSVGAFYYDKYVSGQYGTLLEDETVDRLVLQVRTGG